MSGLRDENAVRIGHTLNPFGEVHIFALDAFAVCNDLAEMNADAKVQLPLRRHVPVVGDHLFLDRGCAPHRVHCAVELGQQGIPDLFDQPPFAAQDGRPDRHSQPALEFRARSGFIAPT